MRRRSLIGQRGRPPSDADLIDAVREGKIEAYGKLYERHVRSATILAMQLSSSSTDADDLVSDAFAKVLAALRTGGGPGAAFRPYLLTAVRHAAYDRTRKEKRLELAGDIEEVPGATRATSVPFRDKAVEDLDQALAATAFASLPERWQTVLWHTAIEGQSPGEIAPLLGLTANGVSAMAFRAREGLRKAFLQAHVAQEPAERCRTTVTKLGAWTRGGLKGREAVQLDSHLDDCARCRNLASELADVNGALRSLIAPVVLGTGAAGYLAAGAAKGAAVSLSATSWLGVAASAAAVVVVAASGVVTSDNPGTSPGAAPTITQSTTTAAAPTSSSGSPQTSGAAVAPGSTSGAAVPAASSEPDRPETTSPGEAELTADAPGSIAMTSNGPPDEMNIAITNTGTAPTTVPTLTLNLPDKIKTVGAGRVPAGSIGCPAGKGTITCTGGQTLEPGQTITFKARLQAGPKAGDGTITGTAGSLQVSIPITIAEAK